MNEELNNFIHDLFLKSEYLDWRSDLKSEAGHK